MSEFVQEKWRHVFFFHAEAYLSKILVKMSQMNAKNVLMFHVWHFVQRKMLSNQDSSSDPWAAPCPTTSAATAGRSTEGESSAPNQPWSGSFQSTSQSFKEKDSSISIFASYWLIQVLLAEVNRTVYLWSAQLRVERRKYWGDWKQKWIATLGFLGRAEVLLLWLVAIRGAQALLFPAAFELPQQWYFCGVQKRLFSKIQLVLTVFLR